MLSGRRSLELEKHSESTGLHHDREAEMTMIELMAEHDDIIEAHGTRQDKYDDNDDDNDDKD